MEFEASSLSKFLNFTKPEIICHIDETDYANCRKRLRKAIDNPTYIITFVIDDEDYIAEASHMAVMPYQGFYIGFTLIFNHLGQVRQKKIQT